MAEPQKRYGMLGLVQGTSTKVLQQPEELEFSWPHLVIREAIAFALFLAILSLVSVFFDAPLEDIANPAVTPNPAKAPWYFLGLQELLHIFPPFWAGVALPGAGVLALIALPYLDKNPSRRFKDRKVAIAVFLSIIAVAAVLTIIGVYFRGPGWKWVWPWIDGVY